MCTSFSSVHGRYTCYGTGQADLKVICFKPGGDPERKKDCKERGLTCEKMVNTHTQSHIMHLNHIPECNLHAKHFMWLDYHVTRFFKVLCFSLQQNRPK